MCICLFQIAAGMKAELCVELYAIAVGVDHVYLSISDSCWYEGGVVCGAVCHSCGS